METYEENSEKEFNLLLNTVKKISETKNTNSWDKYFERLNNKKSLKGIKLIDEIFNLQETDYFHKFFFISELLKSRNFIKYIRSSEETRTHFFEKILNDAKAKDKILKHDSTSNYLHEDLCKIIVSREGNNLDGIITKIIPETKELLILTPELIFEKWKYNPKGTLRTELDWNSYY
jgi:hypothetical protein